MSYFDAIRSKNTPLAQTDAYAHPPRRRGWRFPVAHCPQHLRCQLCPSLELTLAPDWETISAPMASGKACKKAHRTESRRAPAHRNTRAKAGARTFNHTRTRMHGRTH